MSVINTNITSMIGQQNLSKSQNDLTTSMERLSSGLRINSAKDDAAGQAIANRMTAQITGLSTAQRNANDGISVAQTAEGGLNQINDNLQRVRELTVQAQNGTNSENDLTSIQDEIGQRLAEIDRISAETDFNGTKVLSSDNGLQIQVGAEDGQTITVGLQQINAETLGLADFNVNGQVKNELATAADLSDNINFTKNTDGSFTTTENQRATAQDISALVDSGALTETVSGTFATATANDVATISNFVAETAASGTIAIDGTTYTEATGSYTTSQTGESYAAAQNDITTSLDFENNANANGLIKVDTTDTASTNQTAYVDSDGNLFTDAAGETAVKIDAAGAFDAAAGTAASVSDFLQGGTGTGAIITVDDGVAGSVSYTDTGTDVTVGGTYSATEVESFIRDSNALVTSSSGFQVSAENTVQNADATQAYYDSTGTALAANAGAAAADSFEYTVTGNTVAQVENVGGVAGASEDTYVDGDESGVAALTSEAGREVNYFAIEDADGNVVELNSRSDGEGDTLYIDSQSQQATTEASSIVEGKQSANPLASLDAALNRVDSLRSELGAVQNRFDSAIENLGTNETNLSAARSRIEDADYATEVANMTRAQILQQAGTSVLAQANQIPQSVLSLLG